MPLRTADRSPLCPTDRLDMRPPKTAPPERTQPDQMQQTPAPPSHRCDDLNADTAQENLCPIDKTDRYRHLIAPPTTCCRGPAPRARYPCGVWPSRAIFPRDRNRPSPSTLRPAAVPLWRRCHELRL